MFETHQTSVDGRFDMVVTEENDEKSYAVLYNGADLRGIGIGRSFKDAMRSLLKDIEGQKGEYDDALAATKKIVAELESNG